MNIFNKLCLFFSLIDFKFLIKQRDIKCHINLNKPAFYRRNWFSSYLLKLNEKQFTRIKKNGKESNSVVLFSGQNC